MKWFALWLGLLLSCSAATPEAQDPSQGKQTISGDVRAQPSQARRGSSAERPTPPPLRRAPPLLAPPVNDGSAWGSAHPLTFEAASPARNWIVVCQAREDSNANGRIEVELSAEGELFGDRLVPYLLEVGEPDRAIDSFVGSDPSGQYVAFRRGAQLWLRDTSSNTELDLVALGADPSDDASSYTPHRSVHFNPAGRTIAYLRGREGTTEVVIRDLPTGAESSFPTGPGSIARIQFEPDGQFVRIEAVVEDTNRNGRLDWPYPANAAGQSACSGPIPHYRVWQFPGDEARTRLLDTATARLFDVNDFVMTVSGSVITRSTGGALNMKLPNGELRRISSERCAGRILHADAESESILFGCAGAYGARRDMYLRSRGGRSKLKLDLAAYELDTRYPDSPVWLPLYPRNDTVLLHVATGSVYVAQPGTHVLATHGTNALAERAGRRHFLHLAERAPTGGSSKPALVEDPPIGSANAIADVVRSGRFVAVGIQLFDLLERRDLGMFERPPFSLSQDGLGLIPKQSATMRALAAGPLHWRNAVP